MKTHSTFLNKEQVKENLIEILENESKYAFASHNKLGKMCYLYESKSKELSFTETDTYQFFINYLNPNLKRQPDNNNNHSSSSVEQIFYKLLLRTMYQVETKSGNSSHFVFLYAKSLLKRLLKDSDTLTAMNEQELLMSLESFWSLSLKPFIEANAHIFDEQGLFEFIENNNKTISKDITTVVIEALKLAGLEGKIFIEDGKQSNYIVELKNGYSFNSMEPFTFLLDNNTSWFRNYPKVLIIDGIIEEVAEIDNVLNKAYETQQSLVIIALGFSEEVAATVKTNNDQKKFDVQLLKFKNDILVLNSINDVSVVCGTVQVSSLLGQSVATTDWNDIPTVDKIQIKPSQVNIENKKTEHSVMSHMKSILDRKKETTNSSIEDVQEIYDLRLKSLASNAVYIYLPNVSEVEKNSLKIAFDNLLRNIKSIMQFGAFDLKLLNNLNNENNHDNKFESIMIKSLKDLSSDYSHEEKVPLLTVALGFLFVTKLCLMIVCSNGIVSLVSQD